MKRSDVAYWHGTDQARCLPSSRYRGVSGLIAHMLRPPSLTLFGHAANQPHSITSPARTGSEGGMVKLSALRRPTTVGFASKRAGVPCCAH